MAGQNSAGQYAAGVIDPYTGFGAHTLECYDCSLTCPKYLRINEMPDEAGEWEFSYRLGDSPGFDCRFI